MISFPLKKKQRVLDESLPEDTRDAYLAADGDTAAFERLVRKYENMSAPPFTRSCTIMTTASMYRKRSF